jgi:hypothetical protein
MFSTLSRENMDIGQDQGQQICRRKHIFMAKTFEPMVLETPDWCQLVSN